MYSTLPPHIAYALIPRMTLPTGPFERHERRVRSRPSRGRRFAHNAVTSLLFWLIVVDLMAWRAYLTTGPQMGEYLLAAPFHLYVFVRAARAWWTR